MNRRQLIAAAPAAFLAGPTLLGSGEILPPINSQIAEMHREITRLQAIASDREMSEQEVDATVAHMMELADRITEIPARNTHEMLLKFMGQTVNGDHEISGGPNADALWSEACALVA